MLNYESVTHQNIWHHVNASAKNIAPKNVTKRRTGDQQASL